ncbi:LVIVD repeat-containing protein [Salirhabdus salicampi]|uniref:LVIVD repeat-containing protein n=1 Tax=Salirhabdus salicampi TaxID=476102 RepID=UPI0020C50DB5|nr:hypothetical protein [Salirhabdus salicampi]MCP8616326.1 hypothetical protein [Salirhabdus salicampi]
MSKIFKKTFCLSLAILLLLSAPITYACDVSGKDDIDSNMDLPKLVEGDDSDFESVPLIEGSKNVSKLKESADVALKEIDNVPVTAADVYAHKGYAYLGTHYLWSDSNEGVRVFDLSDPENPEEISVFANDMPGTWTEKVIVKSVNTPHFKGDLAAVSVQRFNNEAERVGTILYDVTDPLNPEKLGFWELPYGKRGNGTHELYLTTQGNQVLLLTANSGAYRSTGGEIHDFVIVDVSDPANPKELYQFNPSEAVDHENYRFTDEHGVERYATAHSVIADTTGNYAYVSFWDLGTVILDISDPENTIYLGRTSYEPNVQGAAHSSALAKGGTILIETREVFNPNRDGYEAGWGYTRIYDIKDKSNPVLLSSFRTSNSITQGHGFPGWTVHDPKVRGNTLYLSHYFDGVRVVDITDPANPNEIGSYVRHNANVWGVFVDRNYVLVSDLWNGLQVLQNNAKD